MEAILGERTHATTAVIDVKFTFIALEYGVIYHLGVSWISGGYSFFLRSEVPGEIKISTDTGSIRTYRIRRK